MKSIRFLILLLCPLSMPAMNDENVRKAYSESYKYEKMGNYDDAIKSLLPVCNDSPDSYTPNLRLGWLYYLNGNYANSLERYAKALEAVPSSLEARLGRILPLLAQERYQAAETEAHIVIKTDHYNYYGNLRLAYALRMQKKYGEAEKVNRKMLALYPIDVLYLTEFGLTKHAQGDTETAVDTFYNVLVLDPENVTAKDFLRK